MNKDGIEPIRIATYTRVSSQEQALEGTSLDYQAERLNGYCLLQGWTVINSYVDPGFSGKDGERPGLQRLLSDAKIGLFDKVVVFKLDRLARNLRLLLDIEQNIRSYGISLISIKENIDTSTPTGKMMFQMFGMVAEWERETIIERTKSGKLQRFKDGCWAGGKVPYGYAYDKTTKKLVVSEAEARTARRIFTEYSEGKTLYGTTEGLNKDKVPTRSKKSPGWRESAVRDVLINPMYKGTQIVHRYSNIAYINQVDLSKAITILVPPLVTEEVWNIAQARLKSNKHVKPTQQGEFLLQGIIKCGACGYAFRSERNNGKRTYMCRGRMKSKHLDGSSRCNSPILDAESLENEVWKRISELLDDPNRLILVIGDSINNLRMKEADLMARIKPIDDRLFEIAEQKEKLADDWVIRHMNTDKFKELKESLDKEEERIRAIKAGIDPAQIAELERTRGVLSFWEDQLKAMTWNPENEDGSMARMVDKPHQTALKIIGFEDRALSGVMSFPASKREMLDKLQVKLAVYNDKIEVDGLFPVEPINIQLCTSTGG